MALDLHFSRLCALPRGFESGPIRSSKLTPDARSIYHLRSDNSLGPRDSSLSAMRSWYRTG